MPNKVTIEVMEIDQALSGPSHKVDSPIASGVVDKDLIILQDGSTLDLNARVAQLLESQLAIFEQRTAKPSSLRVREQEPASPTGARSQGVKRPNDFSEDSDSEYESEYYDLEAGDVLGAGVNRQDLLEEDLDDDELSAQLFGISKQPDSTKTSTPQQVEIVQGHEQIGEGNALPITTPAVDPDLPIFEEKTQNFFPDQRVVDWVRSRMDKKMSAEQIKVILEKRYVFH